MVADIGHLALSLSRPRQCDNKLQMRQCDKTLQMRVRQNAAHD